MMTAADLMSSKATGTSTHTAMAEGRGMMNSPPQPTHHSRPSLLLKRKESSAGLMRLQQAQMKAHQEATALVHHSNPSNPGTSTGRRGSRNSFVKQKSLGATSFAKQEVSIRKASITKEVVPIPNAETSPEHAERVTKSFHGLSAPGETHLMPVMSVGNMTAEDDDSDDDESNDDDDESLDDEFGQLVRDLGTDIVHVEDDDGHEDGTDTDEDSDTTHEVASATDVSKAACTDDDVHPVANKFKMRMKKHSILQKMNNVHIFSGALHMPHKKKVVPASPPVSSKRKWSLDGLDLEKVGMTNEQVKRRTQHDDHRHFIHPHLQFRQGWDVISMLFILYNALMIPYSSSFTKNQVTGLEYTERFIDVYFMIELILNFFTGVEVDGKVNFNHKTIVERYLLGWFWVDFVSAFPWFVFDGSSLKFATLFKLFRLLRLLRMFKLSRIMHRLEMALYIRSSVSSLAKFMFATFGVIHWMTCGFFTISYQGADPDDVEGTWVVYQDLLNPSKTAFDQYVASLYWSVMTMTTVGYGDVAPKSTNERVFAVFAMLVGALFFGYGISEVVNIVASLREKDTLFRRQMDTVNSYMKARDLPQELREEIREYMVQLQKSKEHDLDAEEEILDQLSAMLRSKVAFAINDHFLSGMPFFAGSDPGFLLDLALSMRMLYLPPFENVITEGEYGDTMYFIVRGAIEVPPPTIATAFIPVVLCHHCYCCYRQTRSSPVSCPYHSYHIVTAPVSAALSQPLLLAAAITTPYIHRSPHLYLPPSYVGPSRRRSPRGAWGELILRRDGRVEQVKAKNGDGADALLL
jgi:hypothetical protein